MKKVYYIKEPYGLPFELTEKDKFKKLGGTKMKRHCKHGKLKNPRGSRICKKR